MEGGYEAALPHFYDPRTIDIKLCSISMRGGSMSLDRRSENRVELPLPW